MIIQNLEEFNAHYYFFSSYVRIVFYEFLTFLVNSKH